MRRFQGSAFGRAFSILGDSHLAEDAVQDAFVEAFRNLGSLLAPEAFPSWFQRIVLTACNRITRQENFAGLVAVRGRNTTADRCRPF